MSYRSVRDSWRALALRRPIAADLVAGAMFLLGILVAGVLLSSSPPAILAALVGGLIGNALIVGWRHHRRKVSARTD